MAGCGKRTTGQQALLLFAFLQALFILTSTGRLHVTDEAAAFFQARSLVENGALVVPAATTGYEFYGQYDTQGRLRAPNGPAQAVALVPFYLLGRVMIRALAVPPSDRDVVMAFAVTLSSSTFSALAATLWFVLFARRGFGASLCLKAAVACAFGTPLFAYSGWLFSEPLAICLLTGASLAAFGTDNPVGIKRAALTGFLLGACLLVRPTHALVVPVFAAAILVRDGKGGWLSSLALVATAALGVGVYFGWNYHLYGNPLDFGYPEFADGKRLNGFETPMVWGLFGFLLSPGKSVFMFAPAALVAILGLPRLFRRDRGLAVLAVGAPIVSLILFSRYTQWEGGYCFGPRYLLPAIVLLLFGLLPWMETASQAGRRVLLGLIMAGAMIQAIGLATSFLEDQFTSGYYEAGFNYRLSHAPLITQSGLLCHYVVAASRGDPAAPLGKGFDRWFVFLIKAGVGSRAVFLVMSATTAIGAASALSLARSVRSPLS